MVTGVNASPKAQSQAGPSDTGSSSGRSQVAARRSDWQAAWYQQRYRAYGSYFRQFSSAILQDGRRIDLSSLDSRVKLVRDIVRNDPKYGPDKSKVQGELKQLHDVVRLARFAMGDSAVTAGTIPERYRNAISNLSLLAGNNLLTASRR